MSAFAVVGIIVAARYVFDMACWILVFISLAYGH